jgi:hypothetical protein
MSEYNDINLQDLDDRPEPFASIYELMADYTTVEALESLQLLCSLAREEDDTCPECRDQAAWLANELMQLLAKYARRFPPIESRINYHGNGRVQ